jgi:predicted ATPase
MEKYVLTGGPGSGKSSLILALEKQGEYTISEAAEDHIKYRQAQGQSEPWTEPNFQKEILNLQIQREARIPGQAERVFIDRGLYDGLAYEPKESEIYKNITEEATKVKYSKIFLVEPLENVEKTAVRRESLDEALEKETQLEEIYTKAGYDVIRIPRGNLQDRLQKLKGYL